MELMERRRILLNTPHIDIVTGLQFVTDMVAPLESLVMNFSPIQDLHGYDNPWPAGGGKNLLNANANTGSSNNVTYTNNGDGTYTVNGTASGTSTFVVGSIELTANTQYIVSGCPSGGSGSSYNVRIRDANYTVLGFDVGGGATITPTETKTYYYQITVVPGYSVSNLVFKPMICLSTAPNPDYAHFAPYSNICPIAGWTGLDVTRTGKNLCMAPSFVNNIATWGTKPTNFATLAERLNELEPGNYVISCEFTLVTRDNTSDNSTHGMYLLFNDGTNFSNHNLAANKWGTKTVGAKDTVSLPITITESTAGTIKDFRFYGCGINIVGASGSASVANFQVEKGSTGTAYEPYQGTTYPISWQTEAGTVYGGTLDVTTGVLTVDRAMVDLGTLTWDMKANTAGVYYSWSLKNVIKKYKDAFLVPNIMCTMLRVESKKNVYDAMTADNAINAGHDGGAYARMTSCPTRDDFVAAVTGQKLVYELATPVTYQLTPQQVLTLKGTNNLFSNSNGEVTTSYWTHLD